MKKASALAVIALLGGMAAHAQDTKKFRLGLELCPNMGWIATDVKGFENDGTRLGFRFGLLGDVQLGSNANYFFSTGLFLNNIGAKSKSISSITDSAGVVTTTTISGESKYQYVELPVCVKLKTNEIGYMTYFGMIGFDVGILTAAKGKVTGGDFEDASDFAYPLRVALAVGGGLEYNFSGNTSALLGLKYSNAFTNVGKDKVDDVDQPKAKLHYFELTVGALF